MEFKKRTKVYFNSNIKIGMVCLKCSEVLKVFGGLKLWLALDFENLTCEVECIG